MTKVRIGENTYPAALSGMVKDSKWDDRHSITIRLEMTYEEAAALFTDNAEWYVQNEVTSVNEDGEEVTNIEEWDYSAYCVAGAITDYRDGTVTVKMGKVTELEKLKAESVSAEEADAAYTQGVNEA